MLNEKQDYIPFGEEWIIGMKKHSKEVLIDLLANAYKKNINGWISTKERLPEADETVLIVRDYRKWDAKRKPYVDIANVGFLEKETQIGGPVSLSGYHNLQGIYFSVPAILHPDSVTFWQPIPNIDED